MRHSCQQDIRPAFWTIILHYVSNLISITMIIKELTMQIIYCKKFRSSPKNNLLKLVQAFCNYFKP